MLGLLAPLAGWGESQEELEAALRLVDRFLLAGKEGNAFDGARLLDVYESSPRNTEREIDAFFKKKADLLVSYESVGDDLYGYEYLEKGYKGPNLVIEGRVQTTDASHVEFAARLVYRDSRWRILSFEVD